MDISIPALYDLVLIAQPPTQLQNRAAVERTSGATDGAYTEVERSAAQHAIQLTTQLDGLLPCC
jgi:hypothetical protein